MNDISVFPSLEKVSLVAQLLEAGRTDTVYRDLYLERAHALLSALLPHSEYLRLKHSKLEIDDLLRQVAPALTGRKVLIVDDDRRGIFAISRALEAKGMRVLSAHGGIEGVEILRNNLDIDIILMDLRMPGQDGYQTIRVIRDMAPFADIPIIAVTASAMVGDREKSIEAGASDYVAKPVDMEQLLSVMEMWLADRPASGRSPRRPMPGAAAAKRATSQMRTSPN